MKYPNPQNLLIEKHKTIFSVIQKNGCSSIMAQIVEVTGMEKSPNYPVDVHKPKIYPYTRVEDNDMLSNYEEYFRFCIIRNPWERLVSCYKDKIMNASNNFFNASCNRFRGGMPFEEFVHVVASLSEDESDPHFSSQLHHITSPDGYLMVNYFCDLKNLNYHIIEISDKTGIPFTLPDKLNHTNKTSYQEFYTPELVEIVRLRFIGDIDFFKYKYGVKNTSFNFGQIDEKMKVDFKESKFMLQFLKEKNRFFQKRLDSTQRNLIDAHQVNKDLRNSLSWKITAPLRKLGSIFGV